MKKLEFTVPLNKSQKIEAKTLIDRMTSTRDAVPLATKKVEKIAGLKSEIDDKISKLEAGDGTDDKAAADLSAAIVQQRQLARTLQREEEGQAAALSAFGAAISASADFLHERGQTLLARLKNEWDTATEIFFLTDAQMQWQNREFLFNSCPAKGMLSVFVEHLASVPLVENFDEMRNAMDEKIRLINALTEGEVFWRLDADAAVEKAPRVRRVHPMQLAAMEGQIDFHNLPVVTL